LSVADVMLHHFSGLLMLHVLTTVTTMMRTRMMDDYEHK